MTRKDRLQLSHARNLVYLQVVAGIAIAILAADAFNLFEIQSEFFNQAIIINNFVASFGTGRVGLFSIRRKLKQIENTITKEK